MAQKENYDLIIIGAGPGGYVAAVRAAQLGMKVVCIEKEKRLGGVCLNVGCIPSKALLDSSEYFHMAKNNFAEHGIKTGRVTLDLAAMIARKDRVVEELTGNVRKLLEGNKVQVVNGTARLIGEDRVEVTKDSGSSRKRKKQGFQAKTILLATGSVPISVPGLEFDGDRIVSSTEALSFTSVPKHLGIVGGGYIGVEMAEAFRVLGKTVTVIEMLPHILPNLDPEISEIVV